MKRFVDEGAYKYNFYWVLRRGERVDVTCQSCGGHAYIEECQDEITWKCSSCYAHGVEKQVYQYHAKGNCTLCERWFNVEVTDEKKYHINQHTSIVRTAAQSIRPSCIASRFAEDILWTPVTGETPFWDGVIFPGPRSRKIGMGC